MQLSICTLSFLILVISFILLHSATSESFRQGYTGLAGAFIDLATYGELDKYMYGR
jgi:hypothetical protein